MNRSDHSTPRAQARRERFQVKYKTTNERIKWYDTGRMSSVEEMLAQGLPLPPGLTDHEGNIKPKFAGTTLPVMLPYKTYTFVRETPKAPSKRDKIRGNT